MRLTVLGSSASYAGAGQACAGHLVEHEGTRVLMDCGNGVLANLARVSDPLLLDAVFITHGHVDHFADVYALQALLRYAPQGPAERMPLYLPVGLFERMGAILSERGRAELDEAFLVHVLNPSATYRIGNLQVQSLPVDHGDAAFALRVEGGGATLCYTSDTAPGDAVLRAARGCDMLLAEATMPEPYVDRAPHMSARQAGEIAREAGAASLVLVHIWPTNDRSVVSDEAARAYGGPVTVAAEFDTFDIPAAVPGEGA